MKWRDFSPPGTIYQMELRISIFTIIRYFIEIKVPKIKVFTFGPVDHTKADFPKVCRGWIYMCKN